MSVFLGFVKTWVKLPSSALILQFDVLSLVSWIAGLPSVSNVLSEYFPSLGWTLSWPTVVQESCGFFGLNSFLTYCCAGELRFLWAELFLDLLLCRRVAVRQLHCQSALFLWAELFLDLLLCRRVTVCQLHRSTSWCLVFSFLPRSCFCCQIYQLFFWFSLHTQVYISRLYKVQTL